MERLFADFASRTSRACGQPLTFVFMVALVLVWALTGPLFHFSETWQLVINTGTTIITFLMVFLIQNTQNRDNAAVQAKLDEIILTSKADNHYIGIERLTDSELAELQQSCAKAAEKRLAIATKAGEELKERKAERTTSPRSSKARPAAARSRRKTTA